MKNLFYSLCLLIGFSSSAQSIDYQINDLNNSKKFIALATKSISSIFFTINEEEVVEEDVAFDFDIKQYLPKNFNAFAGLFDAFDIANEDADEAFDFDTTAYLPVGFNATIQFEDEAHNIAAAEEEDMPFDFDTSAYLPVGFNAMIVVDEEAYTAVNIEEDEAFDFNTADYLPVGFNTNTNIYDSIVEIDIEEEDTPFEFDTKSYLTEGFDAHESRLAVSTIYYLNCIAISSI